MTDSNDTQNTQLKGASLDIAELGEAQKRDKRLRFNNLLHHITLQQLTEAYQGLNHHAAGGADDECLVLGPLPAFGRIK